MIYARLQVIETVADKATTPLVSGNGDSSGPYRAPFRINGRLSVLDDSIIRHAFDTVQLCLRGIITSSIGYRRVLEDVITLTDIKTPSQFKPTCPTSPDDSQRGRHVDFYFELPTSTSASDGTYRPIPLSGTFKGAVNLNQNHPLNQNCVIPGECEVSYWIEAHFRRAGEQVGFLHRHVQIRSLYPRLRASLTRATPLTIRAKPDIFTRCRLQKCPDLSLTLSDSGMVVERDPATGKRRITLPLAVAMNASDAFPVHSRQSMTCAAEVKWLVTTRFSAQTGCKGSKRLLPSEVVRKTSMASTQKSTILFRPLPQYGNGEVNSVKHSPTTPFIATSQLDLSVPDAVCQPSLDWMYLARTYTLQLSLQFRGVQGAPNYSVNVSLPLTVSAYGSKADDALAGEALLDDSETDEEDALLEMLGPLGLGQPERQTPLQTRPQRAITRTPPPPYFR
ncbi:hypothetical protein G647_04506 [Cladophialophora carrionii CBS 160.54]|uniref:Arrestin-like N-terminal domain-containing protein n=1 Tax=Cladophialophora carrionii CBS 160.54 TaxID=1279043 RepID=V9DE00_9EURO|nr:uncharacterized protein G647_04506 [Cladophialophora carrionii CBS 160.54]ETI25134.1 hypothetical protein G647_04506 [Cladophialophora carrionii CBS 160.54]